jgi:hypothetical protein
MSIRAKYHDELAALMSKHKGETLTTAQIRQLFIDEYEHLAKDIDWVQPTDHCIDHTCKDACWCSKSDNALFDYPKRATFVVL